MGIATHATDRRRNLRERAIEYLGGKCRICGYNTCLAALDFHHLDPREKDFTLSNGMTSWARIKPELDKCVLLCSRCHRETHDGFHPDYIVYEDSYDDAVPFYDDDQDFSEFEDYLDVG